MTENPTNGHHCPNNITLEERGAYASYVIRFKKQLPGGMNDRERKLLSRFAEDGDIRKIDEFFRAHFEICPYCKSDYDQAIAQETLFTDDPGDLHVRLLSDAAKEEDGKLVDLLDLTRKMREARLVIEDTHGPAAREFIDYVGDWGNGQVDVRSPDHEKMESHVLSCKPCQDYFKAVAKVAEYRKKK